MHIDGLKSVVSKGDALIVVPPFAGLCRPFLAAHLLQACARRAGLRVSVFYANLALAKFIGETNYEAICDASTSVLLGERFFAATAYGVPPFGRGEPDVEAAIFDLSSKLKAAPEIFRTLEAEMGNWVTALASAIVDGEFAVVGCSTTFEQTAASVAILDRIKAISPSTITILGGANCEGEMAEGILSLKACIDYVFSGESEETFPHFLAEILAGRRPAVQIITGAPCMDMDSLPTPDFTEFFKQRDFFLPQSVFASNTQAWLPYEGARGCWWGEKHHCTFCGINGLGMQFREKSAERVISELRELTERHGVRRVCMVDNIMPYNYFKTLIPRLGEEVPSLQIFYEQKANLSLDRVIALKKAGVAIIQPGIEALSTELLRRMDKGVTAQQNIALLRHARSVDVNLTWNLLYGFPGDKAEDYWRTLGNLPYLRHLQPPSGPCRLSVDRFSPYFFASSKYGIRSLRPMDGYFSVLPDTAEVAKIAYHFFGDYDSESLSDAELLKRLETEIDSWRNAWETEDGPPPVLSVVALSSDDFVIVDTRGLNDTLPIHFINRAQAIAALIPRPSVEHDETIAWSQENRLAIELDGWHVPLATASPTLLQELEIEWRANAKMRMTN